jgi:hypothetical protein
MSKPRPRRAKPPPQPTALRALAELMERARRIQVKSRMMIRKLQLLREEFRLAQEHYQRRYDA